MDELRGRLTIVPADALADLCDLADLAAKFREEEQGHEDSLVNNLRCAARSVRHRSILEPA